jgi:hypothetical protein
LIVLEDVIEHEKLDFLNEKMVTDATYLQSLGDKGPYNYNKGCAIQSWKSFQSNEGMGILT